MPVSHDKPKVLVQLDADPHPSVFDSIVAVDAGVDQLLRHAGVRPEDVRALVYGAIFTRGVEDLHRTAVFIGGSDATAGEALLAEVCRAFLGPLRVSVMLDSGGSNTTAAAAVRTAQHHLPLRDAVALVLGGSGSVGRRIVRLLAGQGAVVRVSSIALDLAQAACRRVAEEVPSARLSAHVTATVEQAAAAAQGAGLVFAAGPPGTLLMPARVRESLPGLKVAIDLNAVEPVGLEGISPLDRGVDRHGAACYGAIGVGGLKMKLHKAAVRRLFESRDQVLDIDEIFQLAQSLP